MKAALFVLVYLLAGCDFLPAISRVPFSTMWQLVPKDIRTPNLFTKPPLVENDGRLAADIEDGVELIATVFYFRVNERLFEGLQRPGQASRGRRWQFDMIRGNNPPVYLGG